MKINDFFSFPLDLDMKNYSFEEETEFILSGVIIHVGFADAGHYYSYIRDRYTNEWFEFNDSDVS